MQVGEDADDFGTQGKVTRLKKPVREKPPKSMYIYVIVLSCRGRSARRILRIPMLIQGSLQGETCVSSISPHLSIDSLEAMSRLGPRPRLPS